jgi:O-methyltransferase
VVKAGAKDSVYKGGEHAETSRQAVEELILKRMNLDNVEILEGIFPDQTGHLVEGMQFRFCHIDVDVYQSAKDIVDWIWDKIVPGGIIVYDDYGFNGCDGITKYVEDQMKCKDRLVIHNLNGHAIILKL